MSPKFSPPKIGDVLARQGEDIAAGDIDGLLRYASADAPAVDASPYRPPVRVSN